MNADATTSAEVTVALREAGCVWAEEEAALLIGGASSTADLRVQIDRRVNGEPLELVLGWAGFRDLRIPVRPDVFVPRRRTEFLAGQAISAISRIDRPVVVELCCGAGAISASVLNETPGPVTLVAADLDPVATALARANLTRFAAGRSVRVRTGDLFEPLPRTLRGRIDMLVANVPYVPTGDIALLPAESRLYEPRLTVDGGPDGLALFRRLAAGAARWLAPGGLVLSETGEHQVDAALTALAEHGLRPQVHENHDLEAYVVIGSIDLDQ